MTRRALVVDDNRALAEDLGEILASEGYEVSVFHDPVRALEESRELAFDVALLDVRMPKLDGVSLHRHLMETHPDARFVLMTAYTEDDRIAQALAAGVSQVLTKPVSLAALLEAIRHATPSEQKSLLLVEDDVPFGEALSEVLRDSGYTVRLVHSTAEARTAHLEGMTAIIADVRLPDGDGASLALELRNLSSAPVVLITGYDADQAMVGRVGSQARLLTKPFSADALLSALRDLHKDKP
jgi:DNA-binding response OmpR family regulator